ncbi:MAG: tetratricopeptide repeat protein [Byssovorax sp.]
MRTHISQRRLGVATAFFAAMSLASGAARAQTDAQRTGAARALYDQAVTEMATGDYESACPRLEASVKLEPAALGARITLAECYEGGGKLASAWSTYLQIEAAAGAAKQAARQTKAHDRIEALRPRLAQIVLTVPEEVQSQPGLTVLLDGLEIEPATWSVPIPVDKGTHQLVMTATDKKRVEQTFEVDRDGQSVTVKLPRLRGVTPPPSMGPIVDPTEHVERAERFEAREAPSLPRVHIESDNPTAPVQLFRVDGDFSGVGPSVGYGANGPTFGTVTVSGTLSSAVCSAPCNTGVDSSGGREFFLGGDGITPSDRFQLQGMGDPATLRVSPGNRAAWFSGLTFMVLGLTGVAFGAPLLGVGATSSSTHAAGLTTAGGVTLGIGAGLMLIGIPLWRSGRTTFSFRGTGVVTEF